MIMENNVIPFEVPKKKEPRCSFCKKKESEVKSLIKSAVNDHHICNECIRKADMRLKEPV